MNDKRIPAPVPAGWLEALAEGEAELDAGLTVDGDALIRSLYEAADRLEADTAEKRGREAARRR